MKLIETKNAVGHVLCHDLTRIVPGEFKGAQFRKGHVVTEEDIPMLLSMGKEHLYVWEMEPGMLHENDAAERLCRICKNEHMTRGEVKEGKIEFKADCDGLFRVNVEKLEKINMIDELMIATRHSNTPVHAGDKLCGTRVIPLIIREEKLDAADKGMAFLIFNIAKVRGTSKSVLTLDRGACAIKRRSDFLLPAPHAGSPVKSLNLLPRGPVRATFVSRFCGT